MLPQRLSHRAFAPNGPQHGMRRGACSDLCWMRARPGTAARTVATPEEMRQTGNANSFENCLRRRCLWRSLPLEAIAGVLGNNAVVDDDPKITIGPRSSATWAAAVCLSRSEQAVPSERWMGPSAVDGTCARVICRPWLCGPRRDASPRWLRSQSTALADRSVAGDRCPTCCVCRPQ